MLLNSFFSYTQNIFSNIYRQSIVLKNLDSLIFANIMLTLISSIILPSDNIAYFAIFSIILTAIKLLTKTGARVTLSIGDKLLILYFFVVLISVAGSSLFLLSLKGFFKTFVYLGFYVSFVNYINENRNKIKYVLLTLAFLAFYEGFVALYQNFTSVEEISGWQDMSRLNPEQIMTRVYGSLKPYNPNLFGGYMLAIFPSTLVTIFLPLINRHKKVALAGLACFLLAMISIILTGCRGAYIGLFFEFLLIILFTYKFLREKYKKIFITLFSTLSLMGFLIMMSITSLRARIFSIFAMRGDSSNSFRFNVYNSCIEMFKDNWLLGIGVGNQNFREIYGLYMRTGFDALSAYNIYLEMAIESGIFALLSFVSFIAANIIAAFRYIKLKKNINVVYLSIALVSIFGILIHGIVDTVFFRPQIQFVFWVMIGIIRVLTTPRGVSYARARS